MSDPDPDLTQDLFLNGKLRLLQPRRGHRAGHDAILLAAATSAKEGDRLVDFGAGVGAAGLAVARRVGKVRLDLVDIDETLCALARRNAELNRIGANVLALDAEASASQFAEHGLTPDCADVVLMNPPFNDASRHRPSPHAPRMKAHQSTDDTLTAWTSAARRVLRSGGTLTLIWRAEAISNVLAALETGFGGLEILPIHPRPDVPAIRVIVKAIKGSGAALRLHPAFLLNGAAGAPDERAKAVMAGEDLLLTN